MEGCRLDSESFPAQFNVDYMLLGSASNREVDTRYCSRGRRLSVEETRKLIKGGEAPWRSKSQQGHQSGPERR